MLTAPTERQVKKALWYEIRSFWNASPELQLLVPEPALDPSTGCIWPDGRELFGFTASNADNVSGPGGPDVLVVVDEGSGVPRAVWEALQGIRAGGGKVLALGNPTQTSGWFYDAFNERRDGWVLFRISSTETPNFIEGRAVVPGLADREFVAEIAGDYDIDSPIYAVRVLGDFPANVANAVIGLGLLEESRERWSDTPDDCAIMEIGVDVARFGDDYSACSVRRGLRVYTPQFFEREHGVKAVVNGYDSHKVAGMVLQCMRTLREPNQRVRIKIDTTGGYGGAVADVLRDLQRRAELDTFVSIVEINFSEASTDTEKYPLVRDELWFGARKFFKEGGALYPFDPKCDSELVAPTYAPTVKGQNKVEPKDETKKRIGRSPDRAESALLAIYSSGSGSIPKPAPGRVAPRTRWSGSAGRGFAPALAGRRLRRPTAPPTHRAPGLARQPRAYAVERGATWRLSARRELALDSRAPGALATLLRASQAAGIVHRDPEPDHAFLRFPFEPSRTPLAAPARPGGARAAVRPVRDVQHDARARMAAPDGLSRAAALTSPGASLSARGASLD